jgi:hypothetical protein
MEVAMPIDEKVIRPRAFQRIDFNRKPDLNLPSIARRLQQAEKLFEDNSQNVADAYYVIQDARLDLEDIIRPEESK